MNKLNVFLALLPLLIGCGGNKPSGNDDFITVDVTASYPKKELILQDFMDVEYIPLETGGEFYTQGNVRTIGKEFILVRNHKSDGDIFIFDRKGKGVRKFNRKGNGPGEFSFFAHAFLDEDNEEIFVNDSQKRKILVYDLYGNFKRQIKFVEGDLYGEIHNYDQESFICYNSPYVRRNETTMSPTFFILSKQDGSIIKKIEIPFDQPKTTVELLIDRETKKGAAASTPYFFPILHFHNQWLLTEPSADTVYKYLPDHSKIPFLARIPSIQSMKPEALLLQL